MSVVVDCLARQVLDAGLVDDEQHATAIALTLVQTIRAELHEDPESAAVELGFTAGGDIYRGAGQNTGRYLPCFYIEPTR